MSNDEPRFSAQEYGALLSLVMVSDPWPTTQYDRDRIVGLLNDEARARNYNDWVHAYHDLRADVAGDDE